MFKMDTQCGKTSYSGDRETLVFWRLAFQESQQSLIKPGKKYYELKHYKLNNFICKAVHLFNRSTGIIAQTGFPKD